MVAVPITPGMTEWQVAQQYGVSLSSVEAANNVSPTDLQVGQVLIVPTGGSWAPAPAASGGSSHSSPGDHEPDGDSDDPVTHTAPVQQSSPSSVSSVSSVTGGGSSSGSGSSGGSSSGGGGGSLSSIPGVPSSFAACVAYHESTNGTNQAYNGGVYGIISASGINVNGQSLAAQKQAFSQLYSQYGSKPWAGDGCAG